MSFYDNVYSIVKKIPKGKVASYGQIAILAGNKMASRAVGYALHKNPEPGIIPCHRVVNKEGRLAPAFAFGGSEAQRLLLESEGVEVNNNYVDMKIYSWNGID